MVDANYPQMATRLRTIDFDWRNPASASRLSRAVLEGNITELKRLIDKDKSSLNAPDNRGYTPMHDACLKDDSFEAAQLLACRGAYLEHKTFDGMTPLHIACSHGCARTVDLLLEYGAMVKTRTVDCVTPLHVACSYGDLRIIQTLVREGAELNAKDIELLTPIYYAIQHGHPHVVRFLIEKGCDLQNADYFNRRPLLYACTIGNVEIFNLLLEREESPSQSINKTASDGWTLLMEAVQFRSLDIIKRLIELGADTTLPDIRGLLALHLAAYCGSFECFQLVLDNTPDAAIETRATVQPNLDHTRSLPCLLINRDQLDGLKLLFERASPAVLSCPAKMGDELNPPLSFLLLHTNEMTLERKQAFIDTILTSRAPLDPDFRNIIIDRPTVRLVDSVIQAHRPFHDNCICEATLNRVLELGADPDCPGSFRVPQPFRNAMITGFIRALAIMFRYTNEVEPESLLCYFIDELRAERYEWTGHETSLVRFLSEASAELSISHELIRDALGLVNDNIYGKVFTLFEIVRSQAMQVKSLKRLSRHAIRTYFHRVSYKTPGEFRRFILQLPLPRCLIEYVLYCDL